MSGPINFNRSKHTDGLRKIIKQLTLRIKLNPESFVSPFPCCLKSAALNNGIAAVHAPIFNNPIIWLFQYPNVDFSTA